MNMSFKLLLITYFLFGIILESAKARDLIMFIVSGTLWLITLTMGYYLSKKEQRK